MKKTNLRAIVLNLTLILVLSLAFSACASPSGSSNNDAASHSASETESAGTYPLVFDNYGREVVVTTKPQKVLTLGPNCTELFIALGLADYIIGHSLRDHSRGPLPEYATEYEKIPELTYSHATREAVVASSADFIYGIDWEFGDAALDIDELAGYGMTVYMNAAQTLEEQYQEILDIGKIFDVEDVAEAFVADQKARIQAVQDKNAGKQPPNVLIYDHGSDGVFTASGINFESLLVELAGGKNIFDDITDKAWITVSFEEVLARVPDVILIHDYDAPSAQEKIAEIKANDLFAQLDCVKNDRFIIIDLESILPGSRMAYTVERLTAGYFSS